MCIRDSNRMKRKNHAISNIPIAVFLLEYDLKFFTKKNKTVNNAKLKYMEK